MAAHGKVIPDGHQVHHEKFRWNNKIDNLRLVSIDEHYFLTYGRWPLSEEDAYDEYMRS